MSTYFLMTTGNSFLNFDGWRHSGGPFHDLDFSRGFEIELPHLSKLRDAVRLLAANMRVAAARDNYESVTKDALAIMRLADALGNEPIIISQLVRAAMYNALYESAAQNLREGEDTTLCVYPIIRQNRYWNRFAPMWRISPITESSRARS